MAVLRKKTFKKPSSPQVLLTQLKIARDFFTRGKGLIGTTNLNDQEGLWILQCNSIHTFFMSITIDCVFLDRNMAVKALYRSVPPFRFVFPVWGARSVIELSEGQIDRLGIQVGEVLDVVT